MGTKVGDGGPVGRGRPGDGFVLVLDLEDTGHDDVSAAGASVLEVGAILCRDDLELSIVAEMSGLVVPPDPALSWSTTIPYVQRMHTTSGLWEQAQQFGAAVAVVDGELSEWLGALSSDRGIVLAGSGVLHHDERWLQEHMPATFSRLVPWLLDAGVIRRALRFAGRSDLLDVPADVLAKPHRALADAALHRGELARYLRLLSSIPASVA